MNREFCPECEEPTTAIKERMSGIPTNISFGASLCIEHCPSCLWTARDPDEQTSLTYETDPMEGL